MNTVQLKQNKTYGLNFNFTLDNNDTSKTVSYSFDVNIEIEKVLVQAINNSGNFSVIEISKRPIPNTNTVINDTDSIGVLLTKNNYQSNIELTSKHLIVKGDPIYVHTTKPATDGKLVVNVIVFYKYVYH